MSRKGRARKMGNRHPGGKLVQNRETDKGTPELQRRRLMLAGGDPAKVDLTSTPLDVLLANDQISEEEHRAASDYARLYGKFYGKGTVSAAALDGAPKGRGQDLPEDEKRVQGDRARLKRMVEALDNLCFASGSTAAKSIFDNLVVFQRMPRWMQPVFKTQADVRASWLFQAAIREVSRPLSA